LSRICVVIPYFQREPGVLARALRSIQIQEDVEPVSVLIIDDSSPAPAADEVGSVRPLEQLRISVIRRPNGGPAAARNTGLENLPTGTRYVAFLDSDDEWSQAHLRSARVALTADHDVFFANHFQLGQTTPAFERAGRLNYEDHPQIGSEPDLHTYVGNMFDQIMRGNVIGTSTVVYDVIRFPTIRFREEYVSAGEDYLFWMDLAAQGARFSFSTAIHASYGRGINVYSGAEWGTLEHLVRVQNELRYRRATSKLFNVSAEQRSFLSARVKSLRRDFLIDLIHILRHRKGLPAVACTRQAIEDPATFLKAPYLLLNRNAKGN
jgi:succinoglycan biosynthesis protein ExoW